MKSALTKQNPHGNLKTSNIINHAFDQIADRRISPKRFEEMMPKSPTVDKTFPERDVYADRDARLVINRETGAVITVMWGRKLK